MHHLSLAAILGLALLQVLTCSHVVPEAMITKSRFPRKEHVTACTVALPALRLRCLYVQ